MNNFFKYKNIFFVGIKGAGISSFACFLSFKGHYVEGVDINRIFHTDSILKKNGIIYFENIYDFSLKDYGKNFDLLIYSTAYSKDTLKVLVEAVEMDIPILSYPEALGEISKHYYSIGVSGVHGKTTTTIFLGIIFKAASLNPNLISGSIAKDFNDNSFLIGDSNIFIAETCEYRNHFLSFNPSMIIVTNIDYEHVDFFKSYFDIENSFIKYINKLNYSGILVINSDEENLIKMTNKIERNDIRIFTLGFNKNADFIIENLKIQNEAYSFDFLGIKNIFIKTPLKHNVLNFASSLLAFNIFLKYNLNTSILNFEDKIKASFRIYKGIKRRVEVLKEKDGVVYIDDYAHHPLEILSTLKGLRSFYKNRRIILDFMPHTFTRTKVFLFDFIDSLKDADILILHNIYLSEREDFDSDELSFKLFKELKNKNNNTYFFREIMDSVAFLKELIRCGDLFITMGAGNNFILHEYL